MVRNRVKRLLRESVRHNMGGIPAGWDCVLIARVPLSAATYAQTEAAVKQLLRRAALGRPIEHGDRTRASAGSGAGFQIQFA